MIPGVIARDEVVQSLEQIFESEERANTLVERIFVKDQNADYLSRMEDFDPCPTKTQSESG